MGDSAAQRLGAVLQLVSDPDDGDPGGAQLLTKLEGETGCLVAPPVSYVNASSAFPV